MKKLNLTPHEGSLLANVAQHVRDGGEFKGEIHDAVMLDLEIGPKARRLATAMFFPTNFVLTEVEEKSIKELKAWAANLGKHK